MGDNQAHPSCYLSMQVFSRFIVNRFVFALLLLCVAAVSTAFGAELNIRLNPPAKLVGPSYAMQVA